jgi:hypothetical protein
MRRRFDYLDFRASSLPISASGFRKLQVMSGAVS